MQVRLKFVGSHHHVCTGARPTDDSVMNPAWFAREPHPRLDPNAQIFWKRWDFMASDRAILACRGNQIIGWFRYDLERDDDGIHAAGTWVHPDYRRQGIARQMWKAVLKKLRPRTLRAVAVSVGQLLSLWLIRNSASRIWPMEADLPQLVELEFKLRLKGLAYEELLEFARSSTLELNHPMIVGRSYSELVEFCYENRDKIVEELTKLLTEAEEAHRKSKNPRKSRFHVVYFEGRIHAFVSAFY